MIRERRTARERAQLNKHVDESDVNMGMDTRRSVLYPASFKASG